ncbi:DegT/DnrJ/EryC1/StrS family aminotransferase [Candidatus Magnetaquicoccus inordinatus]|uniref:DegT/DnrJ/EryC1/StrS family aminotransferase n=1 Tax=Candidatus Magnetaquicoccus inordinatus TaxID=2496818 RepID=UPI00102C6354|nr:DegT/DnrJ/EryC1/StrS family aminotransferase [Candidatus Magnetaquicoccus inordinatus]
MSFKVAFFRHDLGQEEIDAVSAALRHPILTTGETVERFERRMADYLGCRHVLAVTSCTGAMHLSLLALGIGPGDEVITTPMTFIATSTAILEAGATPVFVDIEPETGNLDVAQIEAALTPRTKAILPVHLYGRMCDMVAMRQVAERHGLAIIEDAAHCLEGQDRGIRPAGASNTACFSFYATKNITCGEGGALATNDSELYQKLLLLRLHGMTRSGAERTVKGYQHWDMALMGWKYNMSNIEAAILLPQMERVERNLLRRRQLTDRYRELLSAVPGIRLLAPTAQNTVHAHHLFPILVEGKERDYLLQALQSRGISVMVNYRPVHLTHYFAETFAYRPGMYPLAEQMGNTVLSLPLYPTMPDEDVEIVAQNIAALMAG